MTGGGDKQQCKRRKKKKRKDVAGGSALHAGSFPDFRRLVARVRHLVRWWGDGRRRWLVLHHVRWRRDGRRRWLVLHQVRCGVTGDGGGWCCIK